jgi:hypothetical protein
MPIYEQHAVEHIWLIDPTVMTMDAFRLEAGRWLLLGSYGENDKVRMEPFQEIEINLDNLWLESLQASANQGIKSNNSYQRKETYFQRNGIQEVRKFVKRNYAMD